MPCACNRRKALTAVEPNWVTVTLDYDGVLALLDVAADQENSDPALAEFIISMVEKTDFGPEHRPTTFKLMQSELDELTAAAEAIPPKFETRRAHREMLAALKIGRDRRSDKTAPRRPTYSDYRRLAVGSGQITFPIFCSAAEVELLSMLPVDASSPAHVLISRLIADQQGTTEATREEVEATVQALRDLKQSVHVHQSEISPHQEVVATWLLEGFSDLLYDAAASYPASGLPKATSTPKPVAHNPRRRPTH